MAVVRGRRAASTRASTATTSRRPGSASCHDRRVRQPASSPTAAACSTSRSPGSRTPAPPATTPSATPSIAVVQRHVDVALVVGADKVRETSSRSTFWEWMGHDPRPGLGLPPRPRRPGQLRPARAPLPARVAGATREHMAMVAVKNHKHAVPNPKAQLRFEITIEQVLAAPMVVDAVRPLRLHAAERRRRGAASSSAEDLADRYTDQPGLGARRRPRPRPGDAPAQAGHDHVPAPPSRRPRRPTRWRASARTTSTSPRCTTASPASSSSRTRTSASVERFGAAKLVEAGETTRRRPHPGQPQRRPEGQGAPAGRHRHRAVLRDLSSSCAGEADQPGRRRPHRRWPTTSAAPPRSPRSRSSGRQGLTVLRVRAGRLAASIRRPRPG